jgi:tetratricopeptide (TPR) repeat protein
MDGFHDLVLLIKKNWHSKLGILIAELTIALLLATIANLLGMQVIYAIVLMLIGLVSLFIFWFYTNKPPKTPPNKIGFLVSIYCSNEQEQLKVKEDLLVPLKQHIQAGQTGKIFHFMELQQHHAELCLDNEQAQKIRLESGAHYMLFGRVRKRALDDGKIHYIFEFEGAVSHGAIADNVSKSLSNEFAELLPRKVQILAENDLLSFQFTSEWAGLVAKYIIGIAAACSGDVVYAERLYDDVLQRLSSQESNFPVFAKLRERLPIRKAEIYEAIATEHHRNWANTYNPEHINNVFEWIEKIDPAQRNRPGVHSLYAICAFVKNRDIDKAIEYVKKFEQNNNPVWILNMAFLHGYKGELKQSIRQYRAAALLSIEVETINQVEGFINWVVEANPEIVHLNYILGFFNWQIRSDFPLAKKNFEVFLSLCKNNLYIKEQELTSTWMVQINNQIMSAQLEVN